MTLQSYMRDITTKLKTYSLSNYDLMELEPNIKITLSSTIPHKLFADELVNQQGLGIMLYQFPDVKTGHWLGIIRKGHTMEIFDSYAYPFLQLDKHLNLPKSNMPQMILDLIKKSGYTPILNKKQLQDKKIGDNSCGRWVALRLLFHNYNLKDFHKALALIKKQTGIRPIDLAILNTIEL